MVIDEQGRRRLTEAAEAHGVDLVVAFGSRTRNQVHSRSDLDLAVGFRSDRSLDDRIALQIAMERAFPDHEVDLVELRRADPLLLRKIFETPVLLFGEPIRFVQARLLAFHRYEDYRPYLEIERDMVHRRLGLDAA